MGYGGIGRGKRRNATVRKLLEKMSVVIGSAIG